MTWTDHAQCRDMDPDLFMPGDGHQAAAAHAKTLCEGCPVKERCLNTALSHLLVEDVGIWGGTTVEERITIRRERGMVNHGTTTAYTRHKCRCQDCRDVMAEAKRRSERRRIERAIARVHGRAA